MCLRGCYESQNLGSHEVNLNCTVKLFCLSDVSFLNKHRPEIAAALK